MLRRCLRLSNEHLRALGLPVDGSATAKEIKHAYREKARLHHPDVGGDPEQFKRIANAYSVLSGRTFNQTVTNDFYAGAQAKNPHWDYYYGQGRTRDGESSQGTRQGSEHGKHGAEWANHGGADANYSTRDFYRPYESSHGSTGFTADELRAAHRATLLHRAWRAFKKACLFLGLCYCYASYRRDRLEENERARREGYTEAYWELKAADKAQGYDSPLLPSYWERKQREAEEARVEDEKRRKAMGLRNPFDASSVPAGPQAVTFRGQPFTPEGFEARRRSRRAEKNPSTRQALAEALEGIDDISYELEDAEELL